MIRFFCTKCGREYVLADAFAHLPLLCKGCGDRMVVPDPKDSLPEPPPPPSKPPFDQSLAAPPPTLPEPERTPEETGSSEVKLFLSAEMQKKLNLAMPPAPNADEPAFPSPVEAEAPRPDRTRLAWMVDGFAFVVLLAAGAFLGETVARKSTIQIFSDAPASAKFPPTELLLWIGCVAACGLLYVWLGTRGWTLGARIRRR